MAPRWGFQEGFAEEEATGGTEVVGLGAAARAAEADWVAEAEAAALPELAVADSAVEDSVVGTDN